MFLAKLGFSFDGVGFMRPNPVSCCWSLMGLAILGCLVAPLFGQEQASLLPATMNVRLADGFDFPVGKPEAVGYHKARGFTPNGHLGEDWDGDRGGNTDLGDPVYCTGNGVVVLAGNMHMGWGNVVMVRHSYREPAEGNALRTVDSLYGHLDTILVQVGQPTLRGQQIGTIGTGGGLYDAHLHFEIRKNIAIGMFRSAYARDFSNYYDPTAFINAHRQLRGGGTVAVAMNTFTATPGGQGLSAADGAYELGINRSPAKVAEMDSSKLNKSAIELRKRADFEKLNRAYKVDRYDDMRDAATGGAR